MICLVWGRESLGRPWPPWAGWSWGSCTWRSGWGDRCHPCQHCHNIPMSLQHFHSAQTTGNGTWPSWDVLQRRVLLLLLLKNTTVDNDLERTGRSGQTWKCWLTYHGNWKSCHLSRVERVQNLTINLKWNSLIVNSSLIFTILFARTGQCAWGPDNLAARASDS